MGDTYLSTGLGDRNTLAYVNLSFPQLVQDLVTTTEFYSPSVYRCAYNIDPVYQENDGVVLQLSNQGKP